MRRSRATRCKQSSRTTESTPPERPTTRRPEGLTMSLIFAATRSTRLPGAGLLLLDFLELAISDELLEALLEQPVQRRFLDLAQALLQDLLEARHHRVGVAVRPAQRLRHDAVDQPQRFQPRCRDAERLRRLRGVIGTLPQNRSAAFRR